MWLCLLSVLQADTSEKTQLQIFNRKHLYKKYISSQWCSTRSEMQRYFKLDWITNSRFKKLAWIPFLPRTFISKEQYHKASPILSHHIHHTVSLDCELQFHCDKARSQPCHIKSYTTYLPFQHSQDNFFDLRSFYSAFHFILSLDTCLWRRKMD
jgi:hypothetical protein